MIEEGQKLYLVRYALTSGIEIVTSMSARELESGYVRVSERPDGYFSLGRDITLTYEDAVQLAEAMRVAKIASLKKALRKFESMIFISS